MLSCKKIKDKLNYRNYNKLTCTSALTKSDKKAGASA